MLDQSGKLEYLKNYRDRRLRTGVEQGWLSKAGLERFNQAYYREFATVTNGQAPRDPEVIINTLEAQRLAGDEDRKDLADAGIWFKTKDESLKQNVADPNNLDALANLISGKQNRDTVVYDGKVFAPQKLFELPKEEFAKKVHQTPGASNESKARLLAAYDDYKENGVSPYAALSQASDNAGARGLAVSAGQIPELFYGTVGLIGDTLERTIGKGASLRDWGFKGYQEWSEKLQPFSRDTDKWEGMWAKLKQGDAGALVDWAEYNAGYAIGQILEAGATALIGMGAGAVVGGAVEPIGGEIVGAAGGGLLGIFAKQGLKAGVKKAVEKAVYNIAKEEVVTELAKQGLRKGTKEGAEALAKRLAGEQFTKRLASEEFRKMATKKIYAGAGALATMQAYNMQMEAGSIYGALREKTEAEGRTPTDAEIGKAWGWAIAASAMETIGDKIGIDLLHGTYGAILGKSRGAAAAMGGLNGIVAESITEGVQTIFERWGAGNKAFDEEGRSDITNSMIGGAFGGGISGVSGGVMHGHPARRTKEEVAKEEFQAAPEQAIADRAEAAGASQTAEALREATGQSISEEALGQVVEVAQGASKGEKEPLNPLVMQMEGQRVTYTPKGREPVTGVLTADPDGPVWLIKKDDDTLTTTGISQESVEAEAKASGLTRAPLEETPVTPEPAPETNDATTPEESGKNAEVTAPQEPTPSAEPATQTEQQTAETPKETAPVTPEPTPSPVNEAEKPTGADLTMPVPSGEPTKVEGQGAAALFPKTEKQQKEERRAEQVLNAKTFRNTPEVSRVFKENPLIESIINKHGGIVSKSKAPQGAVTSQWDDAPTLASPTHNAIYREGGMQPAEMAQALYNEGVLDTPDVPTMWLKIGEASASALNVMRQNTKARREMNVAERQRVKFEEDAFTENEGERPVTSLDLYPGDTVTINGEKVKVVSVSMEGDVTLEDGETYGVQEIKEGDILWVQKFKKGPREGSTEFLPEEKPKQDLRDKDFLDATGQDSGFRLVGGQTQGTAFTEPDNRTQAEKDAEAGQTRLDEAPQEQAVVEESEPTTVQVKDAVADALFNRRPNESTRLKIGRINAALKKGGLKRYEESILRKKRDELSLQHLAAPNASPAAKRALNNGNGNVQETARALAQYMSQEKEPNAKARIEQELLQIGVTKIPTAQNVEFSGEAGHVTAEGEDQLFKGDRADIIEPGYRFNDTIILPAKARRAQNAQTETPTGPQPQEGAVAENQAVQPDTRRQSLAQQILQKDFADWNFTPGARQALIRAVARNTGKGSAVEQPTKTEDALRIFQEKNEPLELSEAEQDVEYNYRSAYTPEQLATDEEYRFAVGEIKDGLNKLRAAAGMAPLAEVALTEPTSPLENAEPLTPQGMWTEFLRDQDKGTTDDIILGAAQDPLEYGGDETVKRIDTKDAVAALREVYFDDNQVLDRDLEDAVTSLMGEIGVEPDANGVYEVDEAQLEQWKDSPQYIARTGKKKKGRRKTRGLDTSLNTEEVVDEVTGDNPTTDPATLADRLGVSMREAGRRIQSALRELRGVLGTQRVARALNRVHGANQTSARFAGNFGLHPANNAFAALLPPMSTDEQDVVIRALGLDMDVPKPRIIPMPKGGWKVSKKLGLDKAQVRAVMEKVPWLNKVLRLGSLDTRSPGKFLKVLSAIKGDIPPQLHTNLANLASNLESAQDRFGLRVSEHEVPASERTSYAQRTFKGRARQGQVVAAKLRPLHTWPGVSGYVGDNVAVLNRNELVPLRRLTAEQASEEIGRNRHGNERAKHKGSAGIWPADTVKEPYVEVALPLALLDVEFYRESTDEGRVANYQQQRINTPITAKRKWRTDTGKFFATDGGHRIVAAANRGDESILALIPEKDLMRSRFPLIITREVGGQMPTVLAGSQDWAAQMLADPDGKLDVIEIPQSTEELFGKETPRTFGRQMERSRADLQNRKSGFTVFAPKLLPDELRATPGLPQGTGSNPSGAFQSAADVSARVHQAVSRAAIKDAPVGTAEKKALLEAIRSNEQKQLRKWADDNELMLDAAEFDRNWKAQGKLGESEHDLYIDDDTVHKRNVAGKGLAFATYLDYFQRNILFNRYFPATAVSLRGFVEKDGVLMPVIEQGKVDIDTSRPVTEAEVDALVATILDVDGTPIFRKAGRDKYVSRDGLIEISDMHDENVVRTKTGSIVVIDNDINLRTQTGRQANNATPASTFKVPELLLRSCRTVRDFAGLFVGYPNPFQVLARSILSSGHPLTAGFSVENDLAGNGLYNPVVHHAAIKSGASLLAGWHELGHSVTDRALHLASPDLTELEGDHAAYVAKLEEIVGDTTRPDYLRETARLFLAAAAAEGQTKAIATKRATGRNYAYRTIHEFVAESFSNQAYQTRLQDIPDPDRTQSLWESFKNFVRRMFGLPERYVSLFDSVMEATNKTIAADARLGDRVFESEADYWNAGRFAEPLDAKLAYRAASRTERNLAALESLSDPTLTRENQVIPRHQKHPDFTATLDFSDLDDMIVPSGSEYKALETQLWQIYQADFTERAKTQLQTQGLTEDEMARPSVWATAFSVLEDRAHDLFFDKVHNLIRQQYGKPIPWSKREMLRKVLESLPIESVLVEGSQYSWSPNTVDVKIATTRRPGMPSYEVHFRYSLDKPDTLVISSMFERRWYGEKHKTQAGSAALDLISETIIAAQKYGFSKIVTTAGRGGRGTERMTGYFTWPSVGFDNANTFGANSLKYLWKATTNRTQAEADRMKELMGGNLQSLVLLTRTPEGRKLWKKYGRSFDAVFDLTPGSLSIRAFTARYRAIASRSTRNAGDGLRRLGGLESSRSSAIGTGSEEQASEKLIESAAPEYNGRYAEADLRVGDRVVLPTGTATVVSIAPLTVRDDAGSHPATVSDIADVERVVRGQPRQILPASLSGVNRMLEERRAEPVPAKPSDVARLATRAIAYLANNPSGDLTTFQETMSREMDPEQVRSFLEAVQTEGYSHAEAHRESQRNRAIRNAWARKLAEQGVPNAEIERTLNEAGLPIPAKDLRGLVEGVTVNEAPSAEVDQTKPDAREVLGLDTSLNAVSAETDRIYLELARNPAENEAELQRLVDEAASRKGGNGPFMHHGQFDAGENPVPNIGEEGMHFGTEDAARQRAYGKGVDDFIREMKVEHDEELGAWFWSSQGVDSYDVDGEEGYESEEEARQAGEEFASEQGENEQADASELGVFTKVFLFVANPKRVPDQKGDWKKAVAQAKREGHDGLVYRNEFEDKGNDSWVIFRPEQAKSADPVTYDSAGAVIPLSQRFNPKIDSILETSIPSDTLVELHHEAKVIDLAERVLRPLTNAAGIELRFVEDGGTRVLADKNGKPVALQVNARALASGMLSHGTDAEFEAALRDGVFREEMDHVASMLGVNADDIVALMDSMDEGELTKIANSYYSVAPTPIRLVKVQEMMDRVMAEPKTKEEREDRREARWQLGSEYLRMIKQRLELGATTESIALDIRSKPRGVVDTIVRYLKRLLTRWQTRHQLSRDMKLAAAIRRMQDVQRQLEGKAREIARGERKFDPASITVAAENLPTPTNALATSLDIGSPLSREQRMPFWARGFDLLTGRLKTGKYQAGGRNTAAGKFDIRAFRLKEAANQKASAAARRCEYFAADLTRLFKKFPAVTQETVNTALGNLDNALSDQDVLDLENMERTGLRNIQQTFRTTMQGLRTLRQQIRTIHHNYSALTALQQGILSAEQTRDQSIKDLHDSLALEEGARKQARRDAARVAKAQAQASLPPEMRNAVQKFSDALATLELEMFSSGALSPNLKAAVASNWDIWFHRSYAIFDTPRWVDWLQGNFPNLRSAVAAAAAASPNATVPDNVRVIRTALDRVRVDLTRRMIQQGTKQGLSLAQATADAQAFFQTAAGFDRISEYMEDLMTVADGDTTSFLQGTWSGKKSIEHLMPRGNIPEEYRALWGEHKDARVNAAKSLSLLAGHLANHQFLTDLRELGVSEGWITEPGKRPNADGVLLVTEDAANPKWTPLAGCYGPAMLRDALKGSMDSRNLPWIYRQMLAATGLAMSAKTVLYWAGGVRNFVGNLAPAAANGYIRLYSGDWWSDFGHSGGATLSSIWDGGTEAARQDILELISLGVLGEANVEGVLRELMTPGMEARKLSQVGKTERAANVLWSRLAGAAQKGFQTAVRGYSFADEIWKMVAFKTELKYRQAIYGNTKSLESIKRETAEVIKKTLPTYSRSTEAIKAIRRIPIAAPFITFTGAVYNILAGTIQVGMNDIITGREIGNKALEAHGKARLFSFVATMATISALPILGRMILSALDPDDPYDQDDDDALRQHVPDWEKSAALIPLWRDKEKKQVGYFNLTFTNMYDVVMRPFRSLGRDIRKGSNIGETLGNFALEFSDPLPREQIFLGSLMDAARGVDSTGKTVWTQNQSKGEKIAAGLEHVWKSAFMPQTIRSVQDMSKSVRGVVSSSGKAYEPVNAFFSGLLGLKIQDTNVATTLGYAGNAFRMNVRDAAYTFTRKLGSEGTVTDSELKDAYVQSNRQFLEAYRKIARKADAAKKLLHMTDQEIALILEAHGVPRAQVSNILTNTYPRYEPSKKMMEKAIALDAKGRKIPQNRVALLNEFRSLVPDYQPILSK